MAFICSFQDQHLSDNDKRNQICLREAIRNRNVDLVKQLINNGAKADGYHMNVVYHRPLHLAIISRSPEIVEILLNGGASTNLKSRNGETPLTLAAKMENISVVDLLLSHNVDNDEDELYGLSHLHIACMRNKTSVVKKLVLMNQGKEINKAVKKKSVYWAGYTPLHFAVRYGCKETVEFLLNCGASIIAKDSKQMTPLHLADFHRNEDIIDLILTRHKHEVRNPTDAHGLSHFHISCTRDNASVVEHFLKIGVHVHQECNSPGWRGWQPIHFATYYECPNVIELLMKTKVCLGSSNFFDLSKLSLRMGNGIVYDVFPMRRARLEKIREKYGELSDLHLACIENEKCKIEKLLSRNKISALFDFHVPIWTGSTPIHLAVQCGSAGVVRSLLDLEVDFLIQDFEGKTPLHIAFENRQIELFSSILKALNCCDKNFTDKSGLSIFHIFCTTDKLAIIENFISKGVDINLQVGNESAYWAGFTPMHFAILFQKPKVVTLLLNHHADISIKDGLGLTPFDLVIDGFDSHINYEDTEKNISDMLLAMFASLPKNIKETEYKGLTPLHALCINEFGDLSLLQEHLVQHQDEINLTTDLPNSRKSNKCSALHLAMQRHFFNQAKLLLEKGADPLLVNSSGETPLECAVSELGLDWLESDAQNLFSTRLPIETFKPSHFHLACASGFTSIVRHLLNSCINGKLKMRFINSLDDDKQTPLHSLLTKGASATSKKQITHMLLENGSDVDARDFRLQTPLHCALIYSGNFDVACTLVSYGADVNAQDLCGQTPLHLISKTLEETTKNKLVLLLENGADVNIVNERGRSCLMEMFKGLAAEGNPKDCHLILLQHVCKLRTLGYYISDINQKSYLKLLQKFGAFFDENVFIDKCYKELDTMYDIDIDSRTSLYSILLKSPNRMVFYCSNVVLQTMVNSSEFFEKFPIYGFFIRLQLKNSRIRRSLLIKCEKSLILLSRKSLSSVCLETIFQYLSNTDLKNIVLSTARSSLRWNTEY